MNALNSFRDLRAKLTVRAKEVRQSRFFADRLSLGLIVAAVGLNALTLVFLVIRVRPTDVPVPTHFSSLRTFDALGPWYWPFEIAVFGLAVTIANIWFAYSSYSRSRLASFFLLSGAVVVAIFSLLVANAFGAVSPQ